MMTPNSRGALLMMGSMAAFTFNDACIKATAGELPLFQLLTLRGLATSILIYALARSIGALRFTLSRHDWVLLALRGATEASSAFFFLTALLNMPLANVSAVMQMVPLTVTLGAALFFRETIGWRRMLAIGLGFGGMLLIVRPGPAGFNIFALYALAAVVLVTMRDLVTRRMSVQVPSLTITLVTSVSVLVFAGIASLGEDWAPVDLRLGLLLAGAAFWVMGGYLLSVMVMRIGDVSFVAPFRYTSLLCALVLGWALFGEWPTDLTLVGAGVVVSTGLFTLFRERALLRG